MNENRIATAFSTLDAALISTSTIRDELIVKLHKAAKEYEFTISGTTDEGRESFMAVINSLDGLLKGKEKAALDNVKLSLQQRKDNDDHDNSSIIADLLATINPGIVQATDNEIPKDIDGDVTAEYAKSGDTIPDTELQTNDV